MDFEYTVEIEIVDLEAYANFLAKIIMASRRLGPQTIPPPTTAWQSPVE